MTVFTAAEFPDRDTASRRVRQGKLIRLATGLYSDDVKVAPETIVDRQWADIVAKLLPGAVVTDRSAFAMRPRDGFLFVSHARATELQLPGLTIVPSGRNEPAGTVDTQLRPGLFVASTARGLLDNMKASRAVKGRPPRTLSRTEIHDEIVRIIQGTTTVQRQRILDDVTDLAAETGRERDAESLKVFFSSAHGEAPTVESKSRAMIHAQIGKAFDERRTLLFTRIAASLRQEQPKPLLEKPPTGRRYLPFYEAYFSNYIEGTVFSVEEAARIALEGEIPESRPEDAHDISGTYAVLSDDAMMTTEYDSPDEFITALRERHRLIMAGRPARHPGEFKARANRAGMTEFVAPELVHGTLMEGLDALETLRDPFARAVFTMFFVSEVHPFDDGNGRVARTMMNGELARARESRVIVPTILRLDYLSALNKASHNGEINGLFNLLGFAQRWTHQVDFSALDGANDVLTDTHAYVDAAIAEREGMRLILPASVNRYGR